MDELGIAIITTLCSLLPPQEATLLFAGDAMMHQYQLDVARTADGKYDYSTCFEEVKPLISSADYAVVNLETPLAGAPYSGYPQFNAPDSYALALKDAGFDLFLTANNHTLDRRDRGVRSTINALDNLGVDHIGTYYDAPSRRSAIPCIKDINGFKIGFLNYTYGTNGISVQQDVVVDYIDKDKIIRDLKRTRQSGAEIVCVAVHWGEEYHLLPVQSERRLAEFLLDNGVDLVIGGHPHVIQPMELRPNGQLLVYSLGNFISNMKTTDTRGGAVVRAHIRRSPDGNAYVESADYDLVFTVPGSKGGENFRLMFADSIKSPDMQTHCNAFRNSASRIFDSYNINVAKRK